MSLFTKYLNITSNLLTKSDNFIINYSETLGRPIWCSYIITPNNLTTLQGSRKNFRLDPELTKSNVYQLKPTSKIFNGTMTRGHLCPSYIMSHDKSLMSLTYMMSNIIPQHKKLNLESWNRLEYSTLRFVRRVNNKVCIVTGCETTELGYTWFDEDSNHYYQVPNIVYQIVITPFEAVCHIGLNNEKSTVYPIRLGALEKMLNLKIIL